MRVLNSWPSRFASRARYALGAALLAFGILIMNAATVTLLVNEVRRPVDLTAARRWCYRLFAIDLRSLERATCDLLVVDVADDTRATYSRSAVRRLRVDAGIGRRNVLAYLNVGEAEVY